MSEGRGTALSSVNDMLNILEVINQMGSVKRFSRDHLVKDENVLEHIGLVVPFCAVIARRLEVDLELKVDMGKLLLGASFHDVEETLTGDVSRPTKYSSKSVHRGLNSYGAKAAGHVFKTLGLPDDKDIWADAKDDTIEGAIIKMADYASVLVKVLAEVIYYGNRAFSRVMYEMRDAKPSMLDLLDKHPALEHYVDGLMHLMDRIVWCYENNQVDFPINAWIDSFEG